MGLVRKTSGPPVGNPPPTPVVNVLRPPSWPNIGAKAKKRTKKRIMQRTEQYYGHFRQQKIDCSRTALALLVCPQDTCLTTEAFQRRSARAGLDPGAGRRLRRTRPGLHPA